MTADQNATKRIPVTPATQDRLREFRNGLGGSFDDAIAVLMHEATKEGEDDYQAGKRLKDTLGRLRGGA